MDNLALIPLCERAKYLSLKLYDFNKRERCIAMIDVLLANPDFPDLKIGGWLEHIVTICIENGITTIEEERDFSRPIKHGYYKRMGYEIPETIDVMQSKKK
jgi:hypothetical protein